MADWSKPTITSNYITFVDEAKARDVDAATMNTTPIGPPIGYIRFDRGPIAFEEWTSSGWIVRPISIEGGGTGAANASTARVNLGLGTMATQNANAIAVTGGTIANIGSSGSFSHVGAPFYIQTSLAGTALTVLGSASQSYSMNVVGANVSSVSWGLYVQAGYVRADYAFVVGSRDATIQGIIVYGDQVVHLPYRLIIPVGPDRWAT